MIVLAVLLGSRLGGLNAFKNSEDVAGKAEDDNTVSQMAVEV